MTRRPRILLVEDSATQAVRMSYLLEARGWEVACATSAEDALEEFNRHIPDLIVADYHLPGMDGAELCRRVRMNISTRGIPIVMLTADSTEHAELHGLDSGADDYVAKSIDDEVLLLRLDALLRKCRVQFDILGPGDAYFRRARVLVIDDSPTYREQIGATLSADGLGVETAEDGESGLRMVGGARFDCVIVDLVMPGLDGVEVCRRLNEMRRSMDSPIVVLMLTAHETRDDLTRGLEAGADDFVGKSSDLAVLKARIRALLRRKFFQEENQRIAEELRHKELEAIRARTEQAAAEARVALVERLEAANRELADANHLLRETQSQLVHAEKMASLGQLVAGIAHEMNNPLAFVSAHLHTIGAGLERIVAPFEGGLEEAARAQLGKLRRRLEETRAGVDRLRDLVLRLRTFSRVDTHELGRRDLGESVDMALMFLAHGIDRRVTVRKQFDAAPELVCFPGEFDQVVFNLLSNACAAIEGKGEVLVSSEVVDGDFVLRVRDSGRGIPAEHHARVFDPFFTTKPVGEGTGLGLSITYAIVKAHHGRIELDSRPGATEFRVHVPLDLEERVARERAA